MTKYCSDFQRSNRCQSLNEILEQYLGIIAKHRNTKSP